MNLLDRLCYDSGGYTVQEILSSFCNKIKEIIDLVNKNEEVCDEAHTIIENIRNEVVPDLVDDIMKEWQDNGYFDSLVNDNLFELLRTELTTLLNQTISDFSIRLNNFDTQLDKNTKQLSPDFYNGAIVTFIDDDCYSSVTKWQQIANDKGIKLSFAMVKDWVNTSGYCSLDQIKNLQNSGHDILNHTKSHINDWDLSNEEIENEINGNIEYMKEHGLNGYDILVYAGTVPNEDRYKNIVRKKCKYAIANTYNATNKPQDSFYMNRIDSDFRTLSQLKGIVDQAIIDKQWVIILTHSWRADGDINSTGTFSLSKINQLIDYIKSKNVPILKFSEAEKYKGNSFSIGEYSDQNSLYISKDGKHNLNVNNVINRSSINRSAELYEKDRITFETIATPDDTIFNTGGILFTFRSSQANFTYQMYCLWSSNAVYKRRWKDYDKVWDTFERIDGIDNGIKINNNLDESLLMDAPITSYQQDKETIVIIRTPLDTFKNAGGTMKVFRSSQANFSYATFVPWNESVMYIRHWAENSQWGTDIPKWTPWVKMGV